MQTTLYTLLPPFIPRGRLQAHEALITPLETQTLPSGKEAESRIPMYTLFDRRHHVRDFALNGEGGGKTKVRESYRICV